MHVRRGRHPQKKLSNFKHSVKEELTTTLPHLHSGIRSFGGNAKVTLSFTPEDLSTQNLKRKRKEKGNGHKNQGNNSACRQKASFPHLAQEFFRQKLTLIVRASTKMQGPADGWNLNKKSLGTWVWFLILWNSTWHFRLGFHRSHGSTYSGSNMPSPLPPPCGPNSSLDSTPWRIAFILLLPVQSVLQQSSSLWTPSVSITDYQLVQLLSHVQLLPTPWTAAHQVSLSITNHGACSKSCPSSQWCHPTISSSVIPFSSYLQSFTALRSFQMSQFFALGGQSIGVSASVLPMNIQDWFPLGWTGWISLQSKGLSRVFSNTTVQRHQFFGAQLS